MIQTLKKMSNEIVAVAPVAPVARQKQRPVQKERDLETELVDIMELINENDKQDSEIHDKFTLESSSKKAKVLKNQLDSLKKERVALLKKKKEILSLMNK